MGRFPFWPFIGLVVKVGTRKAELTRIKKKRIMCSGFEIQPYNIKKGARWDMN